jgi:hypothetical protein
VPSSAVWKTNAAISNYWKASERALLACALDTTASSFSSSPSKVNASPAVFMPSAARSSTSCFQKSCAANETAATRRRLRAVVPVRGRPVSRVAQTSIAEPSTYSLIQSGDCVESVPVLQNLAALRAVPVDEATSEKGLGDEKFC